MTTVQAPDMNAVLGALAEDRPVFHSEADFRHALAWQIQRNKPHTRVRQEVGNLIEGPDRRYVDIWLPGSETAIELKYVTRAAGILHLGGEFRLRDQSAQDTRRYDFCLDIARLEGVIRAGKARNGYAILLTNDHLYWTRPTKTDANDAEFVLHEDRDITGTLAWSPRAGAGTTKGREMPIEIRGRYLAHWREYSSPAGSGYTRFRSLLLQVRPSRG